MKQYPINRRNFIQITVTGAVIALPAASCGTRDSLWRFFSQEEGPLVEAIADQIIPSDQHPGGKWAGVAQFIDRQLVGYLSSDQMRYRQGLKALEETSRALLGKNFENLAFTEQTALLERIEGNQVPEGIWKNEAPSGFFNMVLDHCMKGFYGTPRHGGNREFISYRMIGLNHPQILGRVKR
jgi:gluconate 2-dehydrogenase gamma chain